MAVDALGARTRGVPFEFLTHRFAAEFGQPLLFFLVSRLLVVTCAIVAFLVRPHPAPWGGIWPGSPSSLWIAVLSRWDAGWYFSIAHDGYVYHSGQESNIAFSPLLPAIMRFGGFVLGRTDADTLVGVGVLASNLALLVAIIYLARLVTALWGPDCARRSVLCLLVFPTSVFLSAAYPESLFLAVCIAAFFEAHRGRWWLAGVLGGLAALTRTYGVLIAVPLALEYALQRRWRFRPDILWLGLAPAGLLAWQLYLFPITGDPFVLRHAQDGFNRSIVPVWQGAIDLIRYFFTPPLTISNLGHKGLDGVCMLLFSVLVLLTLRLRKPSLAVFSFLFLLIIGSGQMFDGVPRYGLELFPAFIVLGQLTQRRAVLAAYIAVACAGSVVITSLYALGWWVA